MEAEDSPSITQEGTMTGSSYVVLLVGLIVVAACTSGGSSTMSSSSAPMPDRAVQREEVDLAS
jgi:hypothetical protein